ncbi:MAG TPA: tryptophan synthase subunit beta [Vicinamibacterales bacterium]|jgi:tryptophan synthase beta subunit
MHVKVCGITRAEDAIAAVDGGASAVGFVFWPASPRYIDPARARAIVSRLPPFVSAVGVFVDMPRTDAEEIVRHVGLSAVQLHGHETPDACRDWPCRVIKAVLATERQLASLDEWPEGVLLLVDALDPERRGGTGQTVDWHVAARMAARRRIVLAGGLAPANVAEAIANVRPFAVDVSSGVETGPGLKDHGRLRAFLAAARATGGGPAPATLPLFGRRDPDARGYYGRFGGRFVPETLMAPVEELEDAYRGARRDPAFLARLTGLFQHYVGRPTPVTEAFRLSQAAGGARVFLKREDLTHTGAHKINNALGQALLAQRMGKTRVIAETGAGQHGVAAATACALLGLRCEVYMGAEDMARQAPNVARMELLGARVLRVDNGSRTLKDAINEAMRDWVANVHETYYLLGSVLGPHPYPLMVREFQAVIGHEARAQMLDQTGCLPDAVVACVGGGSNAIGIFDAFLDDTSVRLIGVEAGGRSLTPGQHAARFAAGSEGVLQGTRTFVLQDADGNIEATHSVSAGMDYAAVGPEHASLREASRTEYTLASDEEARRAFRDLARLEGILPALESAHAVAAAVRLAPAFGNAGIVLVNLSGRGDKDLATMMGSGSDVAS